MPNFQGVNKYLPIPHAHAKKRKEWKENNNNNNVLTRNYFHKFTFLIAFLNRKKGTMVYIIKKNVKTFFGDLVGLLAWYFFRIFTLAFLLFLAPMGQSFTFT